MAVKLFRNLLLSSTCTDQLLLRISFDGGCSLQAPTYCENPGVLVCSVWSHIGITPVKIVDIDWLGNPWGLSASRSSTISLSLHWHSGVWKLFCLTLRVCETIAGLVRDLLKIFIVAFHDKVVFYRSEVEQCLFFNCCFWGDSIAPETTDLGIWYLIQNTTVKYHWRLLLDYLLSSGCLLKPLGRVEIIISNHLFNS